MDAFSTLESILGSVTEGTEKDYRTHKSEASVVMGVLRPLLSDLADVQISNPPSDIEPNAPVIQFALSVRWPRQFGRFSEPASRAELREFLLELLELGCVFHLLFMKMPSRLAAVEGVDMVTLRQEWLREAYAADAVMMQMEKEMYQGFGKAVLDRVIVEKVAPFYKSHGVRAGFLWWNRFKLSGHAKNMFYAGARLAMLYDVASADSPSTERSDIVKVHILHAVNGYTTLDWSIGDDVDAEAVEKFRDIGSGDLYAMTHYEDGEEQTHLMAKTLWDEARRALDAIP